MPDQRFGDDLRLLGDLLKQNDRDRGSDLALRRRPQTGQNDLQTLSGADNLKQALLLRFLTPAGELEQLGHPAYGSRLYELMGEPNNQTNRDRAKLFTLIALQAEPRVEEILSVEVTTNRRLDPTRIDIDVKLKVLDSDTPLNLVFPFFLQGGETP